MQTESGRGRNQWNRDIFEKLIVAQLLKIFSAFDDLRKSTTVLSQINLVYTPILSLRFILLLSFHLILGLTSGSEVGD
jgi:hypothetical protein